MFDWISKMGLDNFIYPIRELLVQFKVNLPNWVYFSLPDGLWVYSFTSALLILWNGKLNLWLIIPFFFGVFCEVAQGLEILNGTFDIMDIFFTFISLIVAVLIIKSKFKQNEQTLT